MMENPLQADEFYITFARSLGIQQNASISQCLPCTFAFFLKSGKCRVALPQAEGSRRHRLGVSLGSVSLYPALLLLLFSLFLRWQSGGGLAPCLEVEGGRAVSV